MQNKDVIEKINNLSNNEMLARCFVFEKILAHLYSNIEGDSPDSRKREIMRSRIAINFINQSYEDYMSEYLNKE